jgi:lipopolysaccharide export system protein LptA
VKLYSIQAVCGSRFRSKDAGPAFYEPGAGKESKIFKMRNRESTRYARWAAIAALLLASVVGGIYLRRAWREARVERNRPAAIPAAVEQQSAAFSFSKVEQDQTLFTVRASHAIQFKDSDKSRLDDVSITIFGKQGTRNDRVHAKACDYQSSSGKMICQGQTLIDLESAEDARKNPGQRAMHVETSDVAFERETGMAVTRAPATFRFPNGTGEATGLDYDSREGTVVLERDVKLQLRSGQHPSDPVTQIQGSRLDFNRSDSIMKMAGPVRVVRGPQVLTAGEVQLALDQNQHIKRAEAHGRPELRFTQPAGASVLDAAEMSVDMTPAGDVSRLAADGEVHGQRHGPAGTDTFSADHAEMAMDAANSRANEPHQLTATGNVVVLSRQAGVLRTLRTAGLQLTFAAATNARQRRVESGRTTAPGVMELISDADKTTLGAARLFATFDSRGQMQLLQGKNGVSLDRVIVDQKKIGQKETSQKKEKQGEANRGPDQSAPGHMTARELDVHYEGGGDWSEMEARGDVHFKQADHTAEAGLAHLTRATNGVRLGGSPAVSDASSRTTASLIEMNQTTGDVTATGRVFTVEHSLGALAQDQPKAKQLPGGGMGEGPAQISADHLTGNSQTGAATYEGHARLWQEDSVVQADSIHLDRTTQRLDATGHVLALLPQESSAGSKTPKHAGPTDTRLASRSAETKAGQIPAEGTVWTIRAPHLTYSGVDDR